MDNANNQGNIPFRIPTSHQLSCQKRIEIPLHTLRVIPSSTIDLIFEVSASLLNIQLQSPSLTPQKAFVEALRPLILCTDKRILFQRVLSASENRHHYLNKRIRFLYKACDYYCHLEKYSRVVSNFSSFV